MWRKIGHSNLAHDWMGRIFRLGSAEPAANSGWMNIWKLRWYKWSGRIDLLLLIAWLCWVTSQTTTSYRGYPDYSGGQEMTLVAYLLPWILPMLIPSTILLGVAQMWLGERLTPAQHRAIALQRGLLVQLAGYVVGITVFFRSFASTSDSSSGMALATVQGMAILVLIHTLRCITFSRHLWRGLSTPEDDHNLP